MKFGFDRLSGFGEGIFDGRRRTDDGPWLYYKLTNEPKGSGELKSKTARVFGFAHDTHFDKLSYPMKLYQVTLYDLWVMLIFTK